MLFLYYCPFALKLLHLPSDTCLFVSPINFYFTNGIFGLHITFYLSNVTLYPQTYKLSYYCLHLPPLQTPLLCLCCFFCKILLANSMLCAGYHCCLRFPQIFVICDVLLLSPISLLPLLLWYCLYFLPHDATHLFFFWHRTALVPKIVAFLPPY